MYGHRSCWTFKVIILEFLFFFSEFLQYVSFFLGPCPWGSISNSVTCNLCGVGTYHASPNSLTCTTCGGGRTTRYPGATSSGECVCK